MNLRGKKWFYVWENYITKRLDIYSDGSCDNVITKRGGWAAVMVYKGKTVKMFGNESSTTSNRMEMTAVLEALERVKTSQFKPDEVIVHTDSLYTVNMFTGVWKVKDKTVNKDLIESYQRVSQELLESGVNVHVKWIKGHSGQVFNEMADKLAEKACRNALAL
jgi:ribonuclease HI